MRPDLTDISIVLDRSGSMQAVRTDTIGGFNKFVEEQRKQPGEALLTLMQFDTDFELVHNGRKLADIPALNEESFVPRGYTALLDAIGRTINETGKRLSAMPEEQRPGKVIFVIITDGEENASKEFKLPQINDMIGVQRSGFKWEFVFLGANQDAIKAGSALGVASGQSMSYAANSQGTQSAFKSAANLTSSYRGGRGASFTAQDRKDQSDAGVK